MIDSRCYYIDSVKQSSYETAEASCVGKFPKGGHLFEPLSIEINDKVLIALREVVSISWFRIGIKRNETVGSDYKFVSSGLIVPYAIPWTSSAPSTSESNHQCVFAHDLALLWMDVPCNFYTASICESV